MKPRVFKYEDMVTIFYNDRYEVYRGREVHRFQEGDTLYRMLEMERGSGSREVHYPDEIEGRNLKCRCKEIDTSGEGYKAIGTKRCKCALLDDDGRPLLEFESWQVLLDD